MAKGGIERILPKNQEIRDTALGNFPKVKEAFEQMSDR